MDKQSVKDTIKKRLVEIYKEVETDDWKLDHLDVKFYHKEERVEP